MHSSPQSGNVFFLILIAVTLFAALSYAITHSTRSGSTNLASEKALLSSGVADSCSASVNAAVLRLKTVRGCADDQISYQQPNGVNPNPNAPTDKHCHIFDPAGAGTAPCGAYVTGNDPCMTSLTVGQSCNNLIYAGLSGGTRIYTTLVDQGGFRWGPSGVTNVTSTTNGLANTNTLMALSAVNYNAAAACRNIGPKWYLPAESELTILYNNRAAGALNGTFDISGNYYWTSTEAYNTHARGRRFQDGQTYNNPKSGASYRVRCIRQD